MPEFNDPDQKPSDFDNFWNSFKKSAKIGLTGIYTGLKGTGRGAIQSTERTLQAVEKMVGADPKESIARERELIEAQRQDIQSLREMESRLGIPGGGKVGEAVGSILPAVAIPGGAKGGLLRRLGTGALAGGAIGSSQLVEEGESKIPATLLGAGFAGGAGLVAGLLGKGVQAAKKLRASHRAQNMLKGMVKGKETQVTKAMEEAGTMLSPGEALKSPLLKGRESRLLVTPTKQAELATAVTKRAVSTRQKVNKLVNDIVAEGDGVAKRTTANLYKAAEAIDVPQSVMLKVNKDPILKSNLDELAADSFRAAELGKFKPGSVGYLNHLKKYIDEKLFTAEQATLAQTGEKIIKGSAQATKAMRKSNTKLTRMLESISPEYKAGKAIAQRTALKAKYKNVMATLPKDASVSAVYNTLAGTPKKSAQFLKDLKTAGVDTVPAKNLLNTMDKIKKSPIDQLVAKQAFELGKHEIAQGLAAAAPSNWIVKLTKGRTHDALIDLIMNPKLMKETLKAGKPITESSYSLGMSMVKAILPTKLDDVSDVVTEEGPGEPLEAGQFQDPDVVLPSGEQGIDQESVLPGVDTTFREQIPEDVAQQVEALPEKQKDAVDTLLEMDPQEYYDTYLKDPETRNQYLKWLHGKGIDITPIMKGLDRYDANQQELQQTGIAAPKPLGLFEGLMILLFGIHTASLLTGRALGDFPDTLLALTNPKLAGKAKQQRVSKQQKLIQAQQKARTGFIGAHLRGLQK